MKPSTFLQAIVLSSLLVGLESQAFVYSDFSSTAGLNFTGNATQAGNIAQLTPAAPSQKGGLWYSQKQHVSSGFNTSFSFSITQPGGFGGGADGIAFAIQNQSATAIGTEYGLDAAPAIGVSFNTFQNPGEVSANFVGIATNGGPSGGAWIAMVDLDPLGINLKDGNVHNASISSDGIGLSLVLDGLPIFSNVGIPLAQDMDGGGNAWAGFGARTGGGYENQNILSWTMVPEPNVSALCGLGLGSFFFFNRRANKATLRKTV